MCVASTGRICGREVHQIMATDGTAQDLFKQLMRDLVTPEMQAMGFSGGYTRTFWIRHGDYSSHLYTQRNRYSTKTETDFWIHLDARHEPTGCCYWEKELQWLVPQLHHWEIEVGRPIEPVAASLLEAIRRYGLPAMQAAMDSPGYPPDPDHEWPRTFPRPGDNIDGDGPPDLGEIAWVIRPLNQEADQWLPMLASESTDQRIKALSELLRLKDDDPRASAALSDRRDRDPSRRVRKYVADQFAMPLREEEDDRAPEIGQIAWAMQPNGQPADKWLARLADHSDAARRGALRMITEKAPDDPRTLPVLLDRLEHDPSPWMRQYMTELLTPRAQSHTVRQALQAAASEDENSDVRWAARYSLRRTQPHSQSP
jgi:hypothetical protein